MSIFKSIEPTVLKENCSAQQQIEKLREIMPKASEPVQEVIEQDISLLEMGLYGENRILFELKNSHVPMYILHDIYLSQGDLSAQIDFLVICQKCTYIIECKNLFGNIEINSKGDFIRTVQFGKTYKKEGIYSPITQNRRHLELIKAMSIDSQFLNIANKLLGDVFSATYIPIVVLANEKTVVNDRYAKKEIKNQVIRVDQLVAFIRNHEASSKQHKRSESDMKDSADRWLARSSENLNDYIEKYRTLEREYRRSLAKKESTESELPICPNCKVPMVKREAKTGVRKGKHFWGCPNFPRCKNIINID